MAKNFFKELDKMVASYVKLSDNGTKTVLKIDEDINKFIIALNNFEIRYNAYIGEKKTKYNNIINTYVSELKVLINTQISNYNELDDFYKNNLKGKRFEEDFNLPKEYILNILNKIDNGWKQIFLKIDKTLDNNGKIFLGNSMTDENTIYSDPIKFITSETEKYKISGLSDNVKIDDKFLDLNIEADSKTYENTYFYSVNGNRSNKGDKLDQTDVFGLNDLSEILKYYNYLSYCKENEMTARDEFFSSIFLVRDKNGKKGFLEEMKEYLEEKKEELLDFKNEIREAGTSLQEALGDVVKKYLWGSVENSISSVDGGKIKDFIPDVSVNQVNIFLKDATSLKAKKVAEIFNFCKNFVEQLQDYDGLSDKIVNDIDHDSLGIDNDQTNKVKRAINEFFESTTLKNNKAINGEVKISTEAKSKLQGIALQSIYKKEDGGLINIENAKEVKDHIGNGQAEYYKINGHIFPQAVYINCYDDNYIFNYVFKLLALKYETENFNTEQIMLENKNFNDYKKAISDLYSDMGSSIISEDGEILLTLSGYELLDCLNIKIAKQKTIAKELLGFAVLLNKEELSKTTNIDKFNVCNPYL